MFYNSIVLFTFIYATLAQTFDKNVNRYSFTLQDSMDGFTLTYKNYYKVIEDTLTNRTYCVVCCEQSKPDECNEQSTIYSNVTKVGIESDAYNVVPFLELLGLEKYVVNTPKKDIFSPCVSDTQLNSTQPDFVFSSVMPLAAGKYVSFSANQDSLTPIQRASWLLYISAFFDQELLASTLYSYIVNNYNCHAANVASQSIQRTLAWTAYNQGTFEIYRDPFYSQLVTDAGGRLVAPNSAQDSIYTASNQVEMHSFSLSLQGAEFILDGSLANLSFADWLRPIRSSPSYINGVTRIPAIESNNVYSIHGLVNSNNVSDWTQRALARPDMALLDVIHLLYPDFSLPSNTYPVWITPFNGSRHSSSNYGNCDLSTAFSDTICVIRGYTGSIGEKPELSAGGKAGISIGTIICFLLICLGALWMYKRYNKRKRHAFYRMNEF